MKKLLPFSILLGGGWILAQLLKPKPQPLTNKVTLITGASAGIGRATARAFAKAGATVILIARRVERLEMVKDELAPYDVPMLTFAADITDEAEMKRLIKTVIRKYGYIDILVNNAGISLGGPLIGQNSADLHRMLAVNIYGPIRLTQLITPIMIAQKSGHIVNIASMAGLIAAPGQTTYSATQNAIVAFSNALRRELDELGIYVSTVLPGWTQTDMIANMDQTKMKEVGLLSPFTTIDEPEIPAQVIVDAVRYRQREVTMGGPQLKLGVLQNNLWPKFLDLQLRWAFRLWFDKTQYMDVIKKLG